MDSNTSTPLASSSSIDTEQEKDYWDLVNDPAQAMLFSGSLDKKGEIRRTWKSRYFVLKPNGLFYYANSKEYELLGMIPLSAIVAISQITHKTRKGVFGIVTARRTFYLSDSEGTCQSWITAIQAAVSNLNITEKTFGEPSITTTESLKSAVAGIGDEIQPTRVNTQSFPVDEFSSEGEPVDPVDPLSDDQQEWMEESSFVNDNIVRCQGYLYKRQHSIGWKKRWFVLRNGKLTEYKDDKEYVVKHMVPLQHLLFIFNSTPPHKGHPFCFKLVMPGKEWLLSSESIYKSQEWVAALNAVWKESKNQL